MAYPGGKKAIPQQIELAQPQATHLGRAGGTKWAIASHRALMGDAGHAGVTDAGAY